MGREHMKTCYDPEERLCWHHIFPHGRCDEVPLNQLYVSTQIDRVRENLIREQVTSSTSADASTHRHIYRN